MTPKSYVKILKNEQTPREVTNKLKKELFVKEVIRTANPIKAIEKVEPSYAEGSKWMMAQRYLQDNVVKDKIELSLDRAGLGVDYLNSRLKTLTSAEKQIVFDNKLVAVSDNPTSLEAVKTAYRLHKVLDDNKTINIDQRQQTVDLSSEHLTKIDITVNKLENLNKQMQLSALSGEVIDAV